MSMSEHTRVDVPVDEPTDTRLRRRRPASRARRIVNAGIGAVAGGAAGAATVWLAAPPDRFAPWFIGLLTLLGATLGYRYGRGVVRATALSFRDAWW